MDSWMQNPQKQHPSKICTYTVSRDAMIHILSALIYHLFVSQYSDIMHDTVWCVSPDYYRCTD